LSFFRYSDPNAGLSQQEELDNYFKAGGSTALQKTYRERQISYSCFSTLVFEIKLKLISTGMLDNCDLV
jgi:hypothetical protein